MARRNGDRQDSPTAERDSLVFAISDPLRVSIIQLLDRRMVATIPELRAELADTVSADLLAQHLAILCDSGCVVAERTPAAAGKTQMAYRTMVGRMLVDPALESKVPMPAIEADDFLHWRELELDELGAEQLCEILQMASRQLLIVKEQSKRRLEITERIGTRFVSGAIAFRSEREGSEGNPRSDGGASQ
ncbi:MAG TPA: hypothetical protein VFJ57_11985 [Solirubrobacterales bacterium]|nr:hypothetical protein [Solirubrobacterales bacterium]